MALKASLLALVLLSAAAALAGCGVKGWPIPMTQQNPAPPVLAAVTTGRGIEVAFRLPAAAGPDKAIVRVIFKYAYLPFEQSPECQECLPLLSSSRTFDLDESARSGEEESFVFIDDEAPYGQKAAYQAIAVDRAGRRSLPSALVYGYNLSLPPPPPTVEAKTLEDRRSISWQAEENFSDPLFQSDHLAYLVERRGPEGTVNLNTRPLTGFNLNDFTANPSRTYRYRVRGARVWGDEILVLGPPGDWAKAAPWGRMSSLAAPTDLDGVSLPAGIYLRFEPVADPEVKGYIIERRERRDPWRQITPPDFTENTFIDRQVKAGQYYEYRVTALDEEGDSGDPGQAFAVLYLPEGDL
ncbi:MAG: fibronectin type III domain-containing protein [Desulfarculales bacterium]|jgi:hypothetical protein|nr:fibronectin type III domain-containing protein [Desulfarculales bacterium]